MNAMRWIMAMFAGCGCCALGFAVSGAAGRRLRMLQAGAQALRHIRTGICAQGETLAQVLCALPTEASAEARAWADFFRRVGEALAARPGVGLAELWRPALAASADAHAGLHALDDEDWLLFTPLWDGLGSTPRPEQQELLDHVLTEVQEQHAGLRGKLADTRRISQTLGLLGGLALFLLLI
jgi:stage III sporulation protein AB